MANNEEFIAYLLDQLQLVGPVRSRRMFGGHGVFLEGLMFALVIDDTLYFKADDANRDDFLDEGLEPFSYRRGDKDIALSYYQAPETALDNTDELVAWGNGALAAALRQSHR
jgi:DNA transformation protein and related proteins